MKTTHLNKQMYKLYLFSNQKRLKINEIILL